MKKKILKISTYLVIFIITLLNIYIYTEYSTNIVKYFSHIEFYHNVRYASNYPIRCSLENNQKNKEIYIIISGTVLDNMSSSNRYSSYYKITKEISNYFQKNNKKFKDYKISIKFSTQSNINNMNLYNYNKTDYKLYENIYDFDCMDIGFPVYYENERIIREKIFSNIKDLYINSLFTAPSNNKEAVYFIQPMNNLKSIKSNIPLGDEYTKEWVDYIKETHPNCEIIYNE